MSKFQHFDEFGALPSGTALLEASAGTGKTHQIANLVCRFVAEAGRGIEEILLVTFGNHASKELRSRVHERLLQMRQELTRILAGELSEDLLANHLAVTDIDQRLALIEGALERFDAATIATTHTFCSQMLDRLGVIADWDGTEQFTNELAQLVEQVCEDQYVAHFAEVDPPPFALDYAQKIAKNVVAHPDPLLRMAEHEHEVAFAEAVRLEVARRKGQARLYTYDDLIERMLTTMQDPVTSEPAGRRLSASYPVVLVDEFQDTDPKQWQILKQAFIGRSTVVLIGDPKQSIYAFRNADLNSYLSAMADANDHYSLPYNYRSDPSTVRAVSTLFQHLEFGSNRVVANPVEPKRTHERLRRRSGTPTPPIRIRVLGELGDQPNYAAIFADLAQQVAVLLDEFEITEDGQQPRPVMAGDIAVLVRERRRARDLVRFLAEQGLPAVFRAGSSIYDTEAAQSWQKVLSAWGAPTDMNIRDAACSVLIGAQLPELMADDSVQLGQIAAHLHEAARVFDDHGVAGAWRSLRANLDIDVRLAGDEGGEATWTNLNQVAELLHAAARRYNLGRSGLLAWLEDKIARSSLNDSQAGNTRLETSAAAIQVMTMHSAKGLQFPIVMLPSVSDHNEWFHADPFLLSHEGQRVLFVGETAARPRYWQHHLADYQAEELRLLYVAATRAQCALYAWWTDSKNVSKSSLHRLLHRGQSATPQLSYSRTPPKQGSLPTHLVRIERFEPSVPTPRRLAEPELGQLSHREFTRTIDQAWGRTSYSALTANAHEAPLELPDEPELDAVSVPTDPALSASLPLGDPPGGTAFGSLVHIVLEHLDWDHDPASALDEVLAIELSRLPMPGVDRERLRVGLLAALHTPLGPLASGRALAEVPTKHRLAELDFDLPLPGGSSVADLADIFSAHVPASHLLGDYGHRLANSAAAPEALNGFLTGSIDVVLEVDGRYLILDYKTNRLGDPGELTVGHYQPRAMAEAMMTSHYPLQALLYAVALHRYLSWRLPGYHPEQHLGGVGYLFVRGMIGPQTPVVDDMPCGVFTWFPPAAMVRAASSVLGGAHA